ncbi:MAG: hypothetical protein NXI31_06880 [bacterium]|nr:hypothetical protein [bacterium]
MRTLPRSLWIGGLVGIVAVTGMVPRLAAQRAPRPEVRLIGQVDRGRLPWRKQLTMLDVLALSSARDDADLRSVFVLRASGARALTLTVDAVTMLKAGDSSRNIRIAAGDLVVFPIQLDLDPGVTRRAERRIYDELRHVELPQSAADAKPAERQRAARDRIQLLGWRLLTDHDLGRRVRLAAELGQPGAGAAVPFLVEALRGKPRVAGAAATALGVIGAEAKAALSALERLAGSEERALQARAKAALRQIRRGLERR